MDHADFPYPVTWISIHENLTMHTGGSPLDQLFVSHFDQTFSQDVPEPASLLLLGAGLALGARKLGRGRR